MNDTNLTIPIAWALAGFLSLCGIVGAMGKLIFSMCMYRIKALEKEVARLSQGCGAHGCFWRTFHPPEK
jgi:hypothetical protein